MQAKPGPPRPAAVRHHADQDCTKCTKDGLGFERSLREQALPWRGGVRTMYGMGTKSEERVELRAPAGRKAKWMRAAERAGVSLSDWARRRLDDLADEELGVEGPPAPSAEDVAEALAVAGALQGSGLRARVHAERETPWTAA